MLLITSCVIAMGVSASSNTDTKVGFEQEDITLQTGQSFYLTAIVNDVDDLYGCQFDIEYNSDYLELVDAEEGSLLSSDGSQTYYVAPVMDQADNQWSAITRLACDEGVDGSGDIIYLYFTALGETSRTTVRLKNIQLVDRNAMEIDSSLLNSGRCIIAIEDDASVYVQPKVPSN